MNNQEKQRRLREQIQTTSAMSQSQPNEDTGKISISGKSVLILFGIIGLVLMTVGMWYAQTIIFTKFSIVPFTFFETLIIYFTFVFTYWILTKPIQTKD